MITRTCVQIAFLFIGLGIVSADSLKFTIQTASGPVGTNATTDLMVESAKGLGAFQLNVSFDSDVIEPVSVEPASGINALVDFNILTPGTLRIAFASSSDMLADGAIVQITWKVKAEGTCQIHVSELRAWEQATSFELPVIGGSSEFLATATTDSTDTIPSSSSEPVETDDSLSLSVILGLGVGLIIVVVVLVLLLRKPVNR